MTFGVYIDNKGYIGEVTAPSRKEAFEFLVKQGFQPETIEIREHY